MLGAPVFRTALFGPWSGNALWTAARAVPSIDLPFADSKSLVDAITGRQLISYARAGSGTYTDSAGVLQTAATDVPRFDHRITSTTTNLAIRSEEFDNATWVQTGLNAFGSGSVANAIAAPDGTVTGDLIEEDTSTGFHRVSQTLISGTISTGTYTASVYVKANQRSRAYISLDDNATGEVTAGFATLTQTFNITTAGSWSGSTASIEDVGDGWFRISLTSTKGDGSSALTLRVGISQVSPLTISYTGNGIAGLYVWGAQLVASDSNGRYVRTTAVAASVSTTESLGLLVEEQRTNLLVRSEEFDNASWAKVNVTTTANTTTAPNGTITADSVTPNTATSLFYTQQNVTTTASTTYTWSVYVKANGFSWVFLDAFDGSNHRTWFDLTNGVIGTVEAGNTSTITPVGNNWYRCTLTRSSAGGSTSYAVAIVAGNNSLNGTGNSSNGIYLWGAQLEAGSGPPTSYIPTTTAAATRNADVAQITGTNFSSWYRQDEGTFYAEGRRDGTADGRFLGLSTGSINNTYVLTTNASRTAIVSSVSGGSFGGGVTTANSFAYQNPIKLAASISALLNENICLNGGVVATGSTTTPVGTLTTLDIGTQSGAATAFFNGTIRRLVYWPQALPGQLQAITQP